MSEKAQKHVAQKHPALRNLTILDDLKKGLTKSEIADKHGVHRSSITRRLKVYEQKGLIHKIGYGVYEVKDEALKDVAQPLEGCQQVVYDKHDIPAVAESFEENDDRYHSLAFKCLYPKSLSFSKVKSRIQKSGLKSEPSRKGRTLLLEFGKNKVEFCNRSLIIYFPKHCSIFSKKPIDAMKSSFELAKIVIGDAEKGLHISFKTNGRYRLAQTSSHNALIKNSLAKCIINEFGHLSVKDEKGEWLVIDNSFDLSEFEITRASYQGIELATFFQEQFNAWKEKRFDLNKIDEHERRLKKLEKKKS